MRTWYHYTLSTEAGDRHSRRSYPTAPEAEQAGRTAAQRYHRTVLLTVWQEGAAQIERKEIIPG